MSTARDTTAAFTVLVTLKVPAEQQQEILRLAEQNLPIFARQRGFISAQILCSQDQTRVVTSVQWISQSDYEASMLSPDWAQCDPRFFQLLDSGAIKMEVRAYEPVCVQEPVGLPR